jgi:hypothetical protein
MSGYFSIRLKLSTALFKVGRSSGIGAAEIEMTNFILGPLQQHSARACVDVSIGIGIV